MSKTFHRFDFYHIVFGDYIEPAILIAEEALRNSNKLLIVAPEDKLSSLSDDLWTNKKDSFIAHGLFDEGLSDFAPIWLSSTAEDNPINADILMLTNGLSLGKPNAFTHVFNLFDGSSTNELENARGQWRDLSLRPQNVCRYFTQTDSGGWHQSK